MTKTGSIERQPRPNRVTLLALGVLSIASLSMARLALALAQWSFLGGLPGVSPFYLAASGIIWTLTGWPLAWGIWNGARWAARLARIFAICFAVFFWLERLISFENLSLAWPENGFFILFVSVALMVFVYWSTTSPKATRFFGVTDERKSSNSTITETKNAKPVGRRSERH